MTHEFVKVEEREGYAVVTLSRSEKRNAVNRAFRRELIETFEALKDKVGVIVLTGSGQAFCAGVDLKEHASDREAGIVTANAEWRDVNVAIRQHPAIFIAAVNGFALGGGLTLINVCDLAVAAESASLGMPEISFATYPGLAGPATQLTLSRKRAAWMILTGKRLDGRTAEEWGLVNLCVPDEKLMETAEGLAAHVAQFDATALSASKRALDVIPAAVTDWRQAFDFGDITNASIRDRTDAQKSGFENFRAGGRSSIQGNSNI